MLLRRSCCFGFLVFLVFLGFSAAAAVFLQKLEADSVLRRRRANSGFLEELKQGNLERECIEEICDYEEAREVFENDDKTRQFWLTYERRDPCLVNPCQNNGTCVYVGTSYECQCSEGFEGRYCQTVFEDSLKCLYQNGLCDQFCDGSGERRRCSCSEGYQLAEDGRSCIAQWSFHVVSWFQKNLDSTRRMLFRPEWLEGTTVLQESVPGECPWQVLVQLNGNSHCGGVLVRPDWVITAAHCIHGNSPDNLTVVAGEQNLDVDDGTEQRVPVSMVMVHPGFLMATGDSDVGLLQLLHPLILTRVVVPVCLPTRALAERELLQVRYHSVSGWGQRTGAGPTSAASSPVLRRMTVPLIQNSQCSQRAQFNLTGTMLCAGYLQGRQESCRGDDGSPLVTLFGSTHFLTGVVAWGQGCAQPGYYGLYANMAALVDWVQEAMKNPKTGPLMDQKPV